MVIVVTAFYLEVAVGDQIDYLIFTVLWSNRTILTIKNQRENPNCIRLYVVARVVHTLQKNTYASRAEGQSKKIGLIGVA